MFWIEIQHTNLEMFLRRSVAGSSLSKGNIRFGRKDVCTLLHILLHCVFPPVPHNVLIYCNGATFPYRSSPLAVLWVGPKGAELAFIGLDFESSTLSYPQMDRQINAQGSSAPSTHTRCHLTHVHQFSKGSPLKVQALTPLSAECEQSVVNFFFFRLYSF